MVTKMDLLPKIEIIKNNQNSVMYMLYRSTCYIGACNQMIIANSTTSWSYVGLNLLTRPLGDVIHSRVSQVWPIMYGMLKAQELLITLFFNFKERGRNSI